MMDARSHCVVASAGVGLRHYGPGDGENEVTEYTDILYRVEGHVATISFNRPKAHNAMGTKLRNETVHALKRAEADDSVSVVVISGEGPSFSSGYDVANTYLGEAGVALSPLFDDWTDQLARQILSDWLTIWELMKPVVAKVHGNCLAGGTEVMSMCDVIFVTDEARIGYPAVRAQATPDLAFFAWKMTMARAKYLQLSGNVITGKQAADWGWATKSFPAAEFEEAVAREVAALASIAPDMLAANKLCLASIAPDMLAANKLCKNQTYEMMGMRTALYAATQWHYASHKSRPNAGQFREIANKDGFKAALQWRDAAFKEVDAPNRSKG
jgi:enoyl-CoA hydratase